MVEVIKTGNVPTMEITCENCKSILRYGNKDLTKNICENKSSYSLLPNCYYYTFRCPVCGVMVEANWIKNNNP